MLKLILLIIVIAGSLTMWPFATSTQVNGQSGNRESFIIKSIFYWIAVVCAFSAGYIISKL